ncbi:hypothetical protein BGZ57DRAFT_778296, partial [Hyaloscypha finlandica]
IFNVNLNIRYYPRHFRELITIALKKLSKKLAKYSEVGGYRLIILLNTIGKVIELVIAIRISVILETYSLLLENYISK